MSARTHELTLDGGLLERGFWLYVWEVTGLDQRSVYYVGRTGDSSSFNAQSPFNRMGQHLGFHIQSNSLRRHLQKKGIEPEKCSFRLVAHGPVLEVSSRDQHRNRRDKVAGLEKALSDAMCAAGYEVLNTVNCRVPLDQEMFAEVREAFGEKFPKLKKAAGASV